MRDIKRECTIIQRKEAIIANVEEIRDTTSNSVDLTLQILNDNAL